MVRPFQLNVTDSTTPRDIDLFFNYVWSHNQKVHMILDTTGCKRASLGRVLSMREVLNKHRPNSKKFIDHTTVFVKSRWAKTLLNIGLSIIRTERPVFVNLSRCLQ